MMRIFYEDEGPIDTLLQIAAGPVRDGDLVGKPCRDLFVKHGWTAQCHGFNVITPVGENVVRLLGLKRPRRSKDDVIGVGPQFSIRVEADGSIVTNDGTTFGSLQKGATADVAEGKSPFAIKVDVDGSVVTHDVIGELRGPPQKKGAADVNVGVIVTWSGSGNWRYRVLDVHDEHAWIWSKGAYGGGRVVPVRELTVVS